LSGKTLILLAIFLLAVTVGLAEPFWPVGGDFNLPVALGQSLAFGILIAQWCRFDAASKGRDVPRWLLWLVALLGVVALPLHLFRSRSPLKALRAAGLAIGFAVLAIAGAAAGLLTSSLWLCAIGSIAAYCRSPV
jgi:peptidoglycan/LPS O-acetylase OafA/YrhL